MPGCRRSWTVESCPSCLPQRNEVWSIRWSTEISWLQWTKGVPTGWLGELQGMSFSTLRYIVNFISHFIGIPKKNSQDFMESNFREIFVAQLGGDRKAVGNCPFQSSRWFPGGEELGSYTSVIYTYVICIRIFRNVPYQPTYLYSIVWGIYYIPFAREPLETNQSFMECWVGGVFNKSGGK